MGAPVYLHTSLFMVLPLYALAFTYIFYDIAGFPIGFAKADLPFIEKLLLGAVLAIFLYIAILIHEAGHAWAAKYKGYQVKGITLFFVGGISEMEHPKDWPKGEADVASSGIIWSVGLGAVLLSVYFLTETLYEGWTGIAASIILSGFGLFNLFLGLMNALPILPMDGGILLRDLLRAEMGLARSSALTVIVSRVGAISIIVIGIYFLSWILVLVGLLLLVTISPRQLES
jgi:Zn-dependent protease